MVEASTEVYSSLHQQFKGGPLRPGEGGYEYARSVWNRMAVRTPGLIARCANVADVQNAALAAEALSPHAE